MFGLKLFDGVLCHGAEAAVRFKAELRLNLCDVRTAIANSDRCPSGSQPGVEMVMVSIHELAESRSNYRRIIKEETLHRSLFPPQGDQSRGRRPIICRVSDVYRLVRAISSHRSHVNIQAHPM